MNLCVAVIALLAYSLSPQLVLSQVPGDLRLVRNGKSNISYSYGRLQIYMNKKWSEICADDFGETEADVACHQLGFVNALNNGTGASYGIVSDVGLSEVYCPTNDYLHLLRCSHKFGQHTCTGDGYVSLKCNATHIWENPYIGQLRLVKGNYTSEGLAEVYCNGQWGTICTNYNGFGDTAANVVCRQLGYTRASQYNHISIRGNYSTPIWLDYFSCPTTSEVCLGACAICLEQETTQCSHRGDLTIQCIFETFYYSFGSNVSTCDYIEGGYKQVRPRLGEVRLVPQDNDLGIVEVVYGENNSTTNKTWTRVCGSGSSSYDKLNALTICSQLGYTSVLNYDTIPSSNPSDRQLMLQCDTKQPHILWCPRQYTICNTTLVVQCSSNSSLYYTGQIRLVGGEYPSEGRLEIYFHDQWGSISSSMYTNYKVEADSACRQLGYTGAVSYTRGTIFGTGTIWYYSPYCRSVQTCFTQCLYSYSIYNRSDYTSHLSDLVINCTFNTRLNVAVGSSELCEIAEPTATTPTDGHDPSGVVIALIIIAFTLFIITCIIVTVVITVCCTIRHDKRAIAKRRRQGVQTVPVRYSTQRQNVTFVVPASRTQLPPGTVLVPAVPSQQQRQMEGEGNEEEKREPQTTDEVAPSNTSQVDEDDRALL